MKIDFSIIIPTRNRTNMLKEALDSIKKQTCDNYEIIIIDDNSSDNTEEFVKKYSKTCNIKYIKNKSSLFAHGSRKKGYEVVQGKYIIFMDDDDFYIDNNFLSDAKKVFNNNDDVSLVIGSTIIYEDDSYKDTTDLKCSGLIDYKEYLNGFSEKYPKPMSSLTAIVKKESLDKMGFDSCNMINDTCIYLYGISCGNVYVINRAVAAYRIHSNNISKKKFKIDFIKDNLNEKRKLFIKLKKEGNLIKPNKWFYNQIRPTAYYFIHSSGYDFITIFYIFLWVLLKGNGIRFLLFKDIFVRLLKRGKKNEKS